MKLLLFACAACVLSGCTTRGVSVSRPAEPHTILESGGKTRGRSAAYVAPVTVENAQQLNSAAFRDLRNNFLLPLQLGPWRYLIDAITLDAEADQVAEWTVLVALDTGARVKIEEFGAWDEK